MCCALELPVHSLTALHFDLSLLASYSNVSDVIFVVGAERAFAAIHSNGAIVAWGESVTGLLNTPNGRGYVSIVSTWNAFAALKADGSITAWGQAGEGGDGFPVSGTFSKIYGTTLFEADSSQRRATTATTATT